MLFGTHDTPDINIVERAHAAQRLLDDPLLAEAFAKIEMEMGTRLLKLGVGDDLERYRLIEAVKTVHNVKAHLRSVLTTGKIQLRKS